MMVVFPFSTPPSPSPCPNFRVPSHLCYIAEKSKSLIFDDLQNPACHDALFKWGT